MHRRRLGAEFGGTEKISRGPNFRMTFFRKKFPFPFLTPKISDALFQSSSLIDRLLSALQAYLPLLSEICNMTPIYYLTKTSISQQKIPSSHLFLTHFVLSRAPHNTTYPNIGVGTDAWAVPHLKFLGDRPPSPPKFLPMRPWPHPFWQ